MCRAKGINLIGSNEIKLPNCTNTSWTVDNIKAKDVTVGHREGTPPDLKGKPPLYSLQCFYSGYSSFYPPSLYQAEVFPPRNGES